MNAFNCTGRLGADPELKQTQGGKTLCKLRVAVDGRGGRDSDEETLWLSVTAWDTTAENCAKYLTKGSRVGISGRLQPNAYDKKDGTRVEGVEVNAFAVDFLTPKGESEAAAPAAPARQASAPDEGAEVPW